MLAIYSGNRFNVVLGLVIQYLSGESTFPGRVSSRVIISYSNIGGVVVGGRLGRTTGRPPTGLMRTHHTPGEYQSHAKDSFFYFGSYTKVGLFISSGSVEGGWRAFITCFGLDMSIRRGLGFMGGR